MAQILILNGPNLNLLGLREPEVYGATTLTEVEAACLEAGRSVGATVTCYQSNHEGALVDAIHAARDSQDAIIINAGAYTHTSIALRDAISGVALPTLELHISNVHAREAFRHVSLIAPVCIGVICGLGVAGYPLAVGAMANHLRARG